MEIFTKKSIVLKIVIALVIVILFNFSAPTVSNASEVLSAIGGTLLEPILNLIVAIGDGIMYLIHNTIMGMDSTLLKVSTTSSDTLPWIVALAGAVGLAIITGGISLVGTAVAGYVGYRIGQGLTPETFYLPLYVVTPEEMFKGEIALLDVNFFNPGEFEDIEINGSTIEQGESSAYVLQDTIAQWYVTLRNFALVILLSMLLYIGIRIVTSSIAQDKAKYKEKLWNWLVAVCLLLFMHYIMSFAITIVETITRGINANIELPRIEMQLSDSYYIETIGQEQDAEGNAIPGTSVTRKAKCKRILC